MTLALAPQLRIKPTAPVLKIARPYARLRQIGSRWVEPFGEREDDLPSYDREASMAAGRVRDFEQDAEGGWTVMVGRYYLARYECVGMDDVKATIDAWLKHGEPLGPGETYATDTIRRLLDGQDILILRYGRVQAYSRLYPREGRYWVTNEDE